MNDAVDAYTMQPTSQAGSELLTDFNQSQPQTVQYNRPVQSNYQGSQQLNNALKSYLAPLRDLRSRLS